MLITDLNHIIRIKQLNSLFLIVSRENEVSFFPISYNIIGIVSIRKIILKNNKYLSNHLDMS